MTDLPLQERGKIDERTRLRYLQAMGIDVWFLKEDHGSSSRQASGAVSKSTDTLVIDEAVDLPDVLIQELIPWLQKQCLKDLPSENGTVHFIGDLNANVLVLSYDANPENDGQQPFCGRNGVLLRAMLRSVGLDFTSVMICDLDVKRSDTQPLESFIEGKSIDVILLLMNPGSTSGQEFQEIISSSPMRLDAKPIDVFVSYHPNYLLINPSEKEQAWENIRHIKNGVR